MTDCSGDFNVTIYFVNHPVGLQSEGADLIRRTETPAAACL